MEQLEYDLMVIMQNTKQNYSKNQRIQLLEDMYTLEKLIGEYSTANIGSSGRWTSPTARAKANAAKHRLMILKRKLKDIDIIIKEVRLRTALKNPPEETNREALLLQLMGKILGVRKEPKDRTEAKKAALEQVLMSKMRNVELKPALEEEQFKTNPDRKILSELANPNTNAIMNVDDWFGKAFKQDVDYGPRPVLDIKVNNTNNTNKEDEKDGTESR